MIHADAEQLAKRAAYRARWVESGVYGGRTLDEEIRRGVQAAPAARFIIDTDGASAEFTTGELYAASEPLAQAMAGQGWRPGDVLVIQLPNGAENLQLLVAALRLGLIIVPVVMIYGASELGFILRQTGARGLAVPDRWRNADMAARLDGLGDVPTLERIYVVGDGSLRLGDAARRRTVRWDDLLRGQRAALPVQLPDHPRQPDDVCLINYTSGTTAAPKGVMHTHHTIGAEIRGYPGLADVPTGGPPALNVVPAGHVGGAILGLRAFMCGDNIMFMNTWDVERAAALMRRHDCNSISGVPLYLHALLDLPALPPSLKTAFTGAAGVPPALIERADAAGLRFMRAFGATEHPTVTGGRAADTLKQRAYTDGRPAPGNLVRLIDDDGREVPCGEPGEICTMGPELFVGYVDAALNAAAFTADGWYRSGDIGVVDADGFLSVVDRKKDIIIRGGENVSSQEVEAIMLRHPAVAEASAVAWPDPVYGERVCVFARLKPGQALGMPEVRAHFAAQGVARQKTPERLVIAEDFERTAMGKVVKAALRKRIAEIITAEAQKQIATDVRRSGSIQQKQQSTQPRRRET